MTQIQMLSVLGPIWAALVVGAVVWVTNRMDDRAMAREDAIRKKQIVDAQPDRDRSFSAAPHGDVAAE